MIQLAFISGSDQICQISHPKSEDTEPKSGGDESIIEDLGTSLLEVEELEGDELREIETIFNESFNGGDSRYPTSHNIKLNMGGNMENEQHFRSNPRSKLCHNQIHHSYLKPHTPVKSVLPNTAIPSLHGRSLLMTPVVGTMHGLNTMHGITTSSKDQEIALNKRVVLPTIIQRIHSPEIQLEKGKPTVNEIRKSKEIEGGSLAKGDSLGPKENTNLETSKTYTSPHQQRFMNYLAQSMGTESERIMKSPQFIENSCFEDNKRKSFDNERRDSVETLPDMISGTKETGAEQGNNADVEKANHGLDHVNLSTPRSVLQVPRKVSLLKSRHQSFVKTDHVNLAKTPEQFASPSDTIEKMTELQGNDSQTELQKLLSTSNEGKYILLIMFDSWFLVRRE